MNRPRSMQLTRPVALLAALLLSPLAPAAYITDDVEVDVYAQPQNQGAVLATVYSGNRVEVLTWDGQFAHITTDKNVTGWIEAKFLSDAINTQGELKAMQRKTRDLEAELLAAKDRLAKLQVAGINDEDLKTLQQNAKDAGWLRAELKKARDRVTELESTAKSRQSETASSRDELEELRRNNEALEQKLAAVLLVEAKAGASAADAGPGADADGWMIRLEWFLGSIASAVIIGIIIGMVWLDRRLRKRHGGFRLY